MNTTRTLAFAAAALTSIGLVAAVPTTANAAGSIVITKVYVNSPGSDDGSNSSLNAEYVKIKNTGSAAKSLTGWTLRDESSHVYTFGSFTLDAGSTVTVRSGKGTNTSATKYWQKSWYVWNNSGGDSARLRDSSGVAKDKCSWATVSSYVTC
jgi:hypothetical protein